MYDFPIDCLLILDDSWLQTWLQHGHQDGPGRHLEASRRPSKSKEDATWKRPRLRDQFGLDFGWILEWILEWIFNDLFDGFLNFEWIWDGFRLDFGMHLKWILHDLWQDTLILEEIL